MNKNLNENQIEEIIKANKPQVSSDEKFKGILRAQTLSALEAAGVKKAFNFRLWIPGAIVLAAVLIAVVASVPGKNGESSILSSGITVTKVSDNAFGSLSDLSGTGSTSGGNATNGASVASTGQAAGGIAAAPAPTAAPMMAANGAGGAAAQDSGSKASPAIIARPIGPNPYPYPSVAPKYVYKGDTFTQDQATMDVLKRTVTPISADQATAAIEGSDFGLVNLSSFGNMQLQNITLSENQNFGYTINLDLTDGSFSIYQNYSTWPQDNNPQPLTAGDVPSDDAVIKIANDFLSSHSFDMGSYGSPAVINNIAYPVPYMEGAAGSAGIKSGASGAAVNMPMIPYYSDTVSVIYPLVVNGKTVYDSSGNETGLNMEVNVRYRRVSNVSGVTTQNYQASSYDAITDVQKILSLAETPNFYPVIYNGALDSASGSAGSGGTGTVQTAEVDLGTPVLGYTEMYTYTGHTSNEFLVPAYIFPVTSDPRSYVPSKNIVVPLIADFIQSSGPGKIIPLSGEGVGGGTTGSTGTAIPPTPAPAPAASSGK